jgi:hypothetical protein
MSDLLAIVGPSDAEDELIDEIASWRPARVTVLVQDGDTDWAFDDSLSGQARRDRLAALLHAIERRTDASVVGLVGDADQLLGWRFDRVLTSRVPLAV